jgi:anti-sigma factor RsiW
VLTTYMEIRIGEHPSEESLERYLLRQSNAGELEYVETHVLACPDCVARLEKTETFIATMRVAYAELNEQHETAREREPLFTRIAAWLTPMRLSWTAALAVLVAALIVAPAQFALRWPVAPAQVNLAAWRGVESVSVPSRQPLSVHLNSIDLPDGAVGVQLVDAQGREVSHGSASVKQDSAQVSLPALHSRGTYFLRLYSVSDTRSGQRDLLREFAFQAK